MPKTVPLRPADHAENAVIDDPVDHMEPLPESNRAELAGVMCRLMVWQGIGGTAETITARYMVLCTALGISIGPQIVSEADIARATGLTRAAVSLMSNELRDQFGIITHNNRSEENRKRCKKAHTQS